MRIGRRDPTRSNLRQFASELSRLAEARPPAGRVCGETCSQHCPECGSTKCDCRCTPHCPVAPTALSGDPAHYPIEPGIMPLVFEMKRQGMFTPCWSCEGHLDGQGVLRKLPQVWFYCTSPLHLRLLAAGLAGLAHGGRLSAPWQVVVTYSDTDNPQTTYSLEPQPAAGHSLPRLQADVQILANALPTWMREEARRLSGAIA